MSVPPQNGSAPKRARLEGQSAETADLQARLIEQLVAMKVGDGDARALGAALATKREDGSLPTLLEVGMTSARAPAIKGWIFKQLEAELTTFQVCRAVRTCAPPTPHSTPRLAAPRTRAHMHRCARRRSMSSSR